MSIGGTASRKITGQEIMNASKLNVGSTPIVSGTVGRVLFQGTGNILQQSANLFWDNTVSGLQLQTENISSSQRGLLVSQFNSGQQAPLISFQKARGTIATPTDVITGDLVGFFQFSARMGGAYTVDRASFGANAASTSGIGVFIIGGSSNGIYNPGIYVHPSNNVAIGSSQSILTGITDTGFRLDVNGTARVSGSELRVGNLQLLTSGSPGATGQGITTTGRKISLQSQGEINIDNAAAYQFLGYADSPVSMVQNATGRTVSFVQVKGGFSSPNYNNTQGNLLWINPVYNMGGTTNAGQILRGIYYNPTLTDLTNATHRAIDLTSGDFVWGTGYSQYYGNSTEGFIQFTTSGGTTQLWLRPANLQQTWNSSYWGRLEHTGSSGTKLLSASYRDVYVRNSVNSSYTYLGGRENDNLISIAIPATTGNVLINTTTDAGFRLDVNGTARVSSTTTIGTSAHPFSSNLLTLISDQGSASFRIGGGSAVVCSSSISAVNLSANDFVQCVRVLVGGAARINATTTDWLSITNWAQSSLGSGNVSANLATFGTTYATINASAQVEIASTTKGFLPPRMTNAQRTAIVSPAVGLIVYCTDVTEGLWVYKSTGWTFIV
jgi:hypothetical protein